MATQYKYDGTWRYKEIGCPNCNRIFHSYDTDGSEYLACSNCDNYYKLNSDGTIELVHTFNSHYAFTPTIAIGKTGHLRKKSFKVVSCIAKWDPKENLYWNEYMLYNPREDDYHVLAELGEDWYLVWKDEHQDYEALNENNGIPDYTVTDPRTRSVYHLYAAYYFRIQYAIGEFDTNILEDEDILRVEEYTSHPLMVVSEKRGTTTTWYKGTHIYTSEINSAFNLSLATTAEAYAEKRAVFFDRWVILRNFTAVAVLAFVAALFTIGFVKPSKQLASMHFQAGRTMTSGGWGNAQVLDGGDITVSGPSAIDFNFKTDLSNRWMEVAVTMINKQTGKTYEFTKSIEYYAGYEGGESWTEGSQDVDAVLSTVPSGTYHINIYPTTEGEEPVEVFMEVEQNTFLYSNLILCLVLVLIYPCFQAFVKDSYYD